VKPGEAAAKIRRHVRDTVQDRAAIVEAAHLGVEIIARAAPVDLGSLKSSAHVVTTPKGARIVIDAPHAGIVEKGSRPHTPPLAPLIAWVKRHRAALGVEGRGTVRDTRGRFTASPAVVAAARAIQRKISLYGTKPRYFVRNSIPALVRALGWSIAKRNARRHGG